jgi:hypothetical protein
VYEKIERSTIMFKPSYSTKHESIAHLQGCTVVLENGTVMPSRYSTLYPAEDYGEGYLQLSIGDILQAAGKTMEDVGSEGAPIRLSGVEITAHVDVRNYNTPFMWPFADDGWNPLGFSSKVRTTISCPNFISEDKERGLVLKAEGKGVDPPCAKNRKIIWLRAGFVSNEQSIN